MVRRFLAQAITMIVVVTTGLVVSGEAALAFTRRVTCGPYSRTITYVADNGDRLGEVQWSWPAPHYLYILDFNIYDGADVSARVDAVDAGVIQYDWDILVEPDPYHIYYPVRKFRAVWNGYASDWYPANRC
ncbi:hypothetical protein [Actinoplanes aureus]|uniref:Uncharacterized protein n=1 Tax=Actinoplanes aureus TaxID=2792083 RepID=A0A931CIC5_9ACTN|nr:hypothetical protein [Actinoplanes aureus]MBG0568192.1 hypothetical protein [Actinoplanes aureus]